MGVSGSPPGGDAVLHLSIPAPSVTETGAVTEAETEALLARYPGLRSEDADAQQDALHAIYGATFHDVAPLLPLAPSLLRIVETGGEELRESALELWAKILRGRIRPADLAALEALLGQQRLDLGLRRAMVTTLARIGGPASSPILARLAASPEPALRRQLASCLGADVPAERADRYPLLAALLQDAEPDVRIEAAGAFTAFADDATAVGRAIELSGSDPEPAVRAAALRAIEGAHQHGLLELLLPAYQAHRAAPSVEVRSAVATGLRALPPDPRVPSLVETLLADPEPEVRWSMADSGAGLAAHPSLAPLFHHAAEHDPHERVRAAAVNGLRGFLSPSDATAYAVARLAADPTEAMHWGAYSVASAFSDQPFGQALLQELGGCDHPGVVSCARAILSMS